MKQIMILAIYTGLSILTQPGKAQELATVAFQIEIKSEHVPALLWQRTYPKEHAKILEESKGVDKNDPFAAGRPLENWWDAVPAATSWGRAIVPRAIRAIKQTDPSNPSLQGASASWMP